MLVCYRTAVRGCLTVHMYLSNSQYSLTFAMLTITSEGRLNSDVMAKSTSQLQVCAHCLGGLVMRTEKKWSRAAESKLARLGVQAFPLVELIPKLPRIQSLFGWLAVLQGPGLGQLEVCLRCYDCVLLHQVPSLSALHANRGNNRAVEQE